MNDGADYVYSTDADKVTVEGGAGDDTIEVYHDSNAYIYGGNNNDRIILHRLSGKDIDNLISFSSKEVVERGKNYLEKKFSFPLNAKDWMKLFAKTAWIPLAIGLEFYDGIKDVFGGIQALKEPLTYIGELTSTSTVNGGAGDDTIVSDGVISRVFEYSQNEGNDVIYNFISTLKLSMLHIKAGSIDAVQVNGTDIILKSGTGSVKLVDAANKKFNLREEDGTLTTRAYGKDENSGEVVCSIFGSSAGEVIKDNTATENFRYVLYSESGDDELHGKQKNDTLYGGLDNDIL